MVLFRALTQMYGIHHGDATAGDVVPWDDGKHYIPEECEPGSLLQKVMHTALEIWHANLLLTFRRPTPRCGGSSPHLLTCPLCQKNSTEKQLHGWQLHRPPRLGRTAEAQQEGRLNAAIPRV